MLRQLVFLIVLLVTGLTNVKSGAHQYQIVIDEEIANASVQVCFDGAAPEYLTVDSNKGNRDLVGFPQSKQGSIEIQGRYWKTKYLPENACVNYIVNLERHHAKRTKNSKSRKNIAYIEKNSWLWLPETPNKDNQIRLNFKLPEWAEISTPWLQTKLSKHSFLLSQEPQEWGYTLLIGDFERHISEVSKGHFLNIASTRKLPKKEEITTWLTDTAKALESYLGVYPVQQTQIILISKSKIKHGPVPWGDFSRGNGFGIRFVIVPSFEIKDFYADWTATHEFSHQLLPNLEYDDIWLSEGLSSYLQYVLMGQSGVLKKEEAWQRIYNGLKRGEKGTAKIKAEPLKLTSSRRKSSGRAGRTMRVYWSGAAYFLKADLALRQQSDGAIGLDDILLKLNRCCIKSDKKWKGEELATKLDELSNSKIFLSSYQSMSSSSSFPEFEELFKLLGVSVPSAEATEVAVEQGSYAWEIMHSER